MSSKFSTGDISNSKSVAYRVVAMRGRYHQWNHYPQKPLPVPPNSEYPHTSGYKPPYSNPIKALGSYMIFVEVPIKTYQQCFY